MTDNKQLDATIAEQSKQIKALKKAIDMLSRNLQIVSKRADRAYYDGKKNAGDITKVASVLDRRK